MISSRPFLWCGTCVLLSGRHLGGGKTMARGSALCGVGVEVVTLLYFVSSILPPSPTRSTCLQGVCCLDYSCSFFFFSPSPAIPSPGPHQPPVNRSLALALRNTAAGDLPGSCPPARLPGCPPARLPALTMSVPGWVCGKPDCADRVHRCQGLRVPCGGHAKRDRGRP